MKNMIALLLLSSACATSRMSLPVELYPNEDGVMQCGANVRIIVDESVPAETYTEVQAAVHAWNVALGFEFAIFSSDTTIPAITFSQVEFIDQAHFDAMTIAVTRSASTKQGCIVRSHIRLISDSYHSYDAGRRASILRHEIGHALGLGHHKGVMTDLMNDVLDPRDVHPLPIKPEHVKETGISP